MFGMKMNPKRIFGMLSSFGVDISTLLPQLEKLLIQQAVKIENELGGKATGVITLNEDKTHLVFSIYSQNPDNPTALKHYKSYPFSELIQKLQNIQNDDTEFIIKPAPDTDTTPAGAIPEPGTEPDTAAPGESDND